MWSLGALLFGHLTRNCRCSHCPGINSNYALHSDGFCASRPPASSTPPPSPLSTHTQSQTHISRFSLPPPPTPPPAPSHTATGELIWLLEHPGPIMNELTKKGGGGGGRGGGGGEKRNAHTRSVSGALSELCTKQSVHVFHSIQSVKCTFTHLCRKIFERSKLSGAGEILLRLFL